MIALDENLFLWINGLAGHLPPLDWFLKGIANDYFMLVSLCLFLLFLWFGARNNKKREHNQRAVICASASLGITAGAMALINMALFRPRPFDELPTNLIFPATTDSSFPSNSVSVIFAVAAAIFIYDRKMGTYLLSLTALHAFSRVYVGIHYPSDVLAGAALGAIIALIMYRFIRLIEPLPSFILKLLRKIYIA